MTEATAPDLARIPAGEFLMGAADAEPDEGPVHRVYVSEFLIGRGPVTQEEYSRFVRATGRAGPAVRRLPLIANGEREAAFRDRAASYVWDALTPPQGFDSHPVVLVTFDDALEYCRWLSSDLGRVVRLPTDAEWEKAARGGLNGCRYPWGDEIGPGRCNYFKERAADRHHGTTAIGSFPPNPFGLHDVAGNVWEWVSDWYGEQYYGSGEMHDPRGPVTGSMRIVRGGSWVNEDVSMLRCAYRHKVPPDTYAYSIGFRIVCVP